jgi:hypothetical protein
MPDSMPVQQPEPAQNWCTGFLAGFKPMSRNIFGARRNGSLICYSAYTGAVQWAPNKSGGKPDTTDFTETFSNGIFSKN